MNTYTFGTALIEAKHRFDTSTGRLVLLRLWIVKAREVFPTNKGRAEFLSGISSDAVYGWVDSFPDFGPYVEKYGPREGYWRWWKSLRRKTERLFYQQLLVFLISIFEVYIEDAMVAALRAEPRCLMSERRSISWETALKLGDYDSVVNFLAAIRAAEVIAGDWYKVVEEYRKLLDVDLSSLIDAEKMAEIFEIRHVIIHKVGLVDERFVNRVRSSRWGMEYSINKEIVINGATLEKMLHYVSSAVADISMALFRKFQAYDEEGNARAVTKLEESMAETANRHLPTQ